MLSETIARKASSLSEQITQVIPSLKENAVRIAGAGAQRQESCRAATEKIMRDLMILSESNQARMFNNYGNIRSDIRKALNNAIENYNLKRNAALGEALNQYNAQLADQASDYFNKKQNYETALSNALANLMR